MDVTMSPEWEAFPDLEQRLSREPDIRRRKLLDNGTTAVLAEVDGDPDSTGPYVLTGCLGILLLGTGAYSMWTPFSAGG